MSPIALWLIPTPEGTKEDKERPRWVLPSRRQVQQRQCLAGRAALHKSLPHILPFLPHPIFIFPLFRQDNSCTMPCASTLASTILITDFRHHHD